MAHWNPEGLPEGMEPGLTAVAFFAAPNLDPPDVEDRVASSGAHGFIVDVCAVEIERETGAVRVTDYVTVHDAGTLLNPLLADGQVLGGFAHGAAAALFEAHVYDEDGQPAHGVARRLPDADGARPPGAADRPPLVAVPVHGARREGARGGEHDVAPPSRSRTPSRTRSAATTSSCRSRRRASGSSSRTGRREARPVRLRPRGLARGGARGARRGRRGREADRGRPEPRPGARDAARPAEPARRREPRRARRGRARTASLRIGATVRQAALAGDDRVHPLVREALPFVGHFVTRNRGTVGGSIAHADGAAELPLCLVALDGTVVVDGPGGRREIPAADFFVTHFLTTLAPGELVVETVWPLAGGGGERVRGVRAPPRRLRAVDGAVRADTRRRRRRRRGAGRASAP